MSRVLANLRSVGVQRDHRWLLHEVDLTIQAGEIVSMIGPNGGGKTTAVQVLIGFLPPDAGTVERAGGLNIGYVPQRVQVNAALPMTVRRLMQLTGPQDDGKIDERLSELGVLDLAESPVQQLSGGEFQRVLFARALLKSPDLLILDEPSQGLDISGESRLYDRIADVRDRLDCGVLLVCHNLHMVMARSDTVVCLNRHVCCAGKPAQIASNEEFVQLFGPDIAKSHALYPHQHDHRHRLDGEVSS
ncbi:MAG: metal ABC transporter ATP-binding protein [Gammaproteobacteria bacterium]|nr:metal ABC transporter ATP-binding protein [Gammaproteobacteria bacterium]